MTCGLVISALGDPFSGLGAIRRRAGSKGYRRSIVHQVSLRKHQVDVGRAVHPPTTTENKQ